MIGTVEVVLVVPEHIVVIGIVVGFMADITENRNRSQRQIFKSKILLNLPDGTAVSRS